jgi:hypothetical protein
MMFTDTLAATCASAGDAANFAIIAATTATNAAASVVVGDVGTSPGTSVTGFGSATVTGMVHDNPASDSASINAMASARKAYACASSLPCEHSLATIGNVTLAAGVYCMSSNGNIPAYTILTLNGDSTARFVFQIVSSFTANSYSSILLTGGALPNNVFWQVGSSATIADSATMVGNVMAYESISLLTSATLLGRTMALNGAITLTTSSITIGDCSADICDGAVPGSDAHSIGSSSFILSFFFLSVLFLFY